MNKYNLHLSPPLIDGWELNRGTGTNEMINVGDIRGNSTLNKAFPIVSGTPDGYYLTRSDLEYNLSPNYKFDKSLSSYASNQLVKYSDVQVSLNGGSIKFESSYLKNGYLLFMKGVPVINKSMSYSFSSSVCHSVSELPAIKYSGGSLTISDGLYNNSTNISPGEKFSIYIIPTISSVKGVAMYKYLTDIILVEGTTVIPSQYPIPNCIWIQAGAAALAGGSNFLLTVSTRFSEPVLHSLTVNVTVKSNSTTIGTYDVVISSGDNIKSVSIVNNTGSNIGYTCRINNITYRQIGDSNVEYIPYTYDFLI